jgi:hypothetical protein
MYHVGSKNENQKELDLLIFFLFEGTENIKRGEWFKIVTGNGDNADRTYYYKYSI